MMNRLTAFPVALLVASSLVLQASVAYGQSAEGDAAANESSSSEAPAEESADDGAGSESDQGSDSPTDYVTPTEKQAELNTKAVQAIAKEEYEKAVDLLKQSLDLGDINITYLNLGRAYQRLRQCETAEQAYNNALTAPPVESPSPYLVEQKIEQYMEELETECRPAQKAGSVGPRGMIRVTAGIATGSARLKQPSELVILSSNYNYRYAGTAWLVELQGGFFVSQFIALHGGLGVDFQSNPTRKIWAETDEIEVEAGETVDGTSLIRATAGVTAYIPAGAYLGFSAGPGWIGIDDETVDEVVDLQTGMGVAFSTKLGWNIPVNEHFGLDIAAYWDTAWYLPDSTTQPNRRYGALGLLLGGTMRIGQ